jgi:hypothetical protein
VLNFLVVIELREVIDVCYAVVLLVARYRR